MCGQLPVELIDVMPELRAEQRAQPFAMWLTRHPHLLVARGGILAAGRLGRKVTRQRALRTLDPQRYSPGGHDPGPLGLALTVFTRCVR